jgi:hypothetical protein
MIMISHQVKECIVFFVVYEVSVKVPEISRDSDLSVHTFLRDFSEQETPWK